MKFQKIKVLRLPPLVRFGNNSLARISISKKSKHTNILACHNGITYWHINNRLQCCPIHYDIVELFKVDLPTKEAAEQWIIDNQRAIEDIAEALGYINYVEAK